MAIKPIYQSGVNASSEGRPIDVKANMKRGEFIYLGEERGSKEMDLHLLKHVALDKVCLFPHKENEVKHDWLNVFFVNLATQEFCSILLKTYSHGSFNKYLRQINQLNHLEGEEIDASIVQTHAVIESFEDKGEDRYRVRFYCCKDKDGIWCDGVDVEGKRTDSEIQFLDKQAYKKGAEIAKDPNTIYNLRVVEEMAQRNFVGFKQLPASDQHLFMCQLLNKCGYVSKDKALELAKGQAAEIDESFKQLT